MEAVYNQVEGVEEVVSGYAGGSVPNPSYEEVCRETTGHAEVVQIAYDPQKVSFKDLLQVFFTIHDPTTPNRQGADVGPRYRSVIFYHSPEQKKAAEETIRELEETGIWGAPIVTEVVPFEAFYPAEDYHQHYFERNPNLPYCRWVIAPKLAKLRQAFFEKLKKG